VPFKKKRIPAHLIIRDSRREGPAQKYRWIYWFLIPVISIGLLLVSINAVAVVLEDIEAGQLLFKDESASYSTSIHVESEVDIVVSGFVAQVTLTQNFVNQTDQWQEAVYVFPLSETAAVNFMRMEIGDRVIRAEIKEKQQARQMYQKAKAEGKRTGLIEQSRPNLFTQSVANIAPKEKIKVEIRFIQSVSYNLGEFSLRFPMTLTPRYIPGQFLIAARQLIHLADLLSTDGPEPAAIFKVNGQGWALPTNDVPDAHLITPPMVYGSTTTINNPISVRVFLNPGLPLKDISSPYHEIVVKKSGSGHQISLRDGAVPMDRDLLLRWQPVVGSEPAVAVFKETIESNDYFMLMMLPPNDTSDIQIMPREMIFVIDTSGSMQGPSIKQAKQSLGQTLKRLRPQDLFNIIEFNDSAKQLFRSSQMADLSNVKHALDWVMRLSADGGTNMRSALQLALNSPIEESHHKHIVFVTDGAVGNEASLFEMIYRQLGNSRLFTVGIGSAPNSFFMRKAAEFGGGTFTHIGMSAEVANKMDTLYQKLDNPIASDIQINWPQEVESYPARLPSLYLNEPLLVVAKAEMLQGDIRITGNTAHLPWWRELSLETQTSHPGIATLWARSKIESLEDEKIAGRDADEVRRAVLDVALTHNLISNYTSLVAVEETLSRFAHDTLNTKALPNLVAQGQIISPIMYPRTATNADLSFVIGAISLALSLVTVSVLRIRRGY